MNYDVVIVGGGIAGLTAAAFLAKEGLKVVLCEKEGKAGGLVNSFEHNGFIFDGGIRAIENSGVVYPMLAQLGLEVEFVQNVVSIGIEDEVIRTVSEDNIRDYRNMLAARFPENEKDIDGIIAEIKKIMRYMDILYGIDNPIFIDIRKNKEYLYHTLLPWLFKYIGTIGKVQKLQMPVDEYLKKFTGNQILIDIIVQHFFKKTPAFFAMSYFSLYLDYRYPKGGTGTLVHKMEEFILGHRGEIRLETEIIRINPQTRQAVDKTGQLFSYKKLIWTSDMKRLYSCLDLSGIQNKKTLMKINARKESIADKIGGDSIITAFITLTMDKSYFEKICSGHFFYTPVQIGLSSCPISEIGAGMPSEIPAGSAYPASEGKMYTTGKQEIIRWLEKFYQLTTYEISIPVMRDPTLAPEGKTGMIVSTLMEYSLVRHISEMGWYEEFKIITQEQMLKVLDSSIFPGIMKSVEDAMVSTPLTIEKMSGNSDGAITGWAFTNPFIPAVSSIQKVMKSVLTPVPDVLQAGQWTFSPAGFPISIMTAKIAADKAIKELKATHGSTI